jgi:hypothetical protein
MNWILPQGALAKEDWKMLIIPACSPNTLAKATLGIRDNPLTEMIGRGIIAGIPIILVTEYFGFTLQTPDSYRELYMGYLQRIKSYGVQVYASLEDLTASITDKAQDDVAKEKPLPYRETVFLAEETKSQNMIQFERKLLSDKDACGFPEGFKVRIKPWTVISPLARDTLKMRGIELCHEMGERKR